MRLGISKNQGGLTVAFEIKPIDADLFSALFTLQVARELDQFIDASPCGIRGIDEHTWAIDKMRMACLLWIRMKDEVNSPRSYALIWNRQVMVIRQSEQGLYSIVYHSKELEGKIVAAKRLMREALRVGGQLLDGTTRPSDPMSVPYAQFVDMSL